MSKEANKDQIDVHELLQEIEKLKQENNHFKKAVGYFAITNKILKTANDILIKTTIEKVEFDKEVLQVLELKCSNNRICIHLYISSLSLLEEKE